MTDRGFQRANDESRQRLAHLVETLTPAKMAVDLGGGWTVASALAHMGFWDRWQAARWQEMLAGRWSADDASVIAAEHLANEALDPFWASVAVADVPALALEAAARLDALLAQASDDLVDALEGGRSAYLLHRHRHRGEHLDQIQRGLDVAAESASAPADRSFIEKNAASRRRLAAIVGRLTAEELARPTEPSEEGSWTVAQVLGHLAFWDLSVEARLLMSKEAAEGGGVLEFASIPDEMTEGINRPLAALLGAWTERIGIDAGAQAVAAAESLDSLLLEVVDRLPAALTTPTVRLTNRWIHREPHLAAIEAALAGSPASERPADRSHLERNETSRARLRKVVGRLTPTGLALKVGDGTWTVGQVLGHLAFWDRFLAARWRAALASGPGERPTYLPDELADMLNDGLPPTWGAFAAEAGRAAIDDALAAAQAVDGVIAGLPAETPVEAILAERPALLDRSIHRLEHLSAIERALAGMRASDPP
ncbi:MAG: DinB family protein [Candidatus Limnocylindrales bacterium]